MSSGGFGPEEACELPEVVEPWRFFGEVLELGRCLSSGDFWAADAEGIR